MCAYSKPHRIPSARRCKDRPQRHQPQPRAWISRRPEYARLAGRRGISRPTILKMAGVATLTWKLPASFRGRNARLQPHAGDLKRRPGTEKDATASMAIRGSAPTLAGTKTSPVVVTVCAESKVAVDVDSCGFRVLIGRLAGNNNPMRCTMQSGRTQGFILALLMATCLSSWAMDKRKFIIESRRPPVLPALTAIQLLLIQSPQNRSSGCKPSSQAINGKSEVAHTLRMLELIDAPTFQWCPELSTRW